MNSSLPWIAEIPETLLRDSLFIYSKSGAYMGKDLHLVAGYGHRCFRELRDPKKRVGIQDLHLEREMHTYCSRWFRPRGVYTYDHMLSTKQKPEEWNICHQCLKRLPGRMLDLNDILLFGPHETIGGVILFDLDLDDKDFALDGLRNAVRLRQI